jgi:hypothetical protein
VTFFQGGDSPVLGAIVDVNGFECFAAPFGFGQGIKAAFDKVLGVDADEDDGDIVQFVLVLH